VTRHVRDQNWVAVGIDFLIVVVGVFIGIQVSNWNDSRKADAELSASLESLAQEISNTAWHRENQLRYEHETIDGLRLVLDLLDGAELSEEQYALALLALSRGTPPPDPSRYGTLASLQASGRLKDIDSTELRNALSELRSIDRLNAAFSERARREMTAPPFDVKLLRLRAPELDGTNIEAGPVATLDVEGARQDPNFRARLIQRAKSDTHAIPNTVESFPSAELARPVL